MSLARLLTCTTCQQEYDPADPAALERHTVPVDGCGCGRCRGRPRCYMCTSSFCFCPAH
jgi:hypothetical protein